MEVWLSYPQEDEVWCWYLRRYVSFVSQCGGLPSLSHCLLCDWWNMHIPLSPFSVKSGLVTYNSAHYRRMCVGSVDCSGSEVQKFHKTTKQKSLKNQKQNKILENTLHRIQNTKVLFLHFCFCTDETNKIVCDMC